MTEVIAAEDPAEASGTAGGAESDERVYPPTSLSAATYSSSALSSPTLSASVLATDPASPESSPSADPSAPRPSGSESASPAAATGGLDSFEPASERTSSRFAADDLTASDRPAPAFDSAHHTLTGLTPPEPEASEPSSAGPGGFGPDSAGHTSLRLTPPEPAAAEPADAGTTGFAGAEGEPSEPGPSGDDPADPAEPPAAASPADAGSGASATADDRAGTDTTAAAAPAVPATSAVPARPSSGSASLVRTRKVTAPEPITAAVVKGRIRVADEVVEKVAALATREVPGVADLGGGPEPALDPVGDRAGPGARRADEGVRAQVQDRQVAIDISIVVEYGRVIMDVANEVKINVARAVSRMIGLRVVEVNVTVEDVRMPGPAQPDPRPAAGPGDHMD